MARAKRAYAGDLLYYMKAHGASLDHANAMLSFRGQEVSREAVCDAQGRLERAAHILKKPAPLFTPVASAADTKLVAELANASWELLDEITNRVGWWKPE